MKVEGKCIGFRPIEYTSKKAGEGVVQGIEVCVISQIADTGMGQKGEFASTHFLRANKVFGVAKIGNVEMEISFSQQKARVESLEFLAVKA